MVINYWRLSSTQCTSIQFFNLNDGVVKLFFKIKVPRSFSFRVSTVHIICSSSSGENMTYIACDLTLTEDIEKLFKAIDKERPDGVDIFINAAGIEGQTK